MHDGEAWPLGEGKSFAPFNSVDAGATRRPVFLHGMWRSGSTYLWSRFRPAPDTCCFYEPLHHGLAKLTCARIEHEAPGLIDSNRHPALSQPYFAEFMPLIDRRGVRGYHRSLAYDRYILKSEEAHPHLERYLSGLLDHAAMSGRRAVLGFNRTSLRLAWLRARFGGFNIHMERDPMAIWASYSAEMAQGNYAFFSMWLTILGKNAAQPLFAPLVERLKLRPSILNLVNAKRRRRQVIDAMSEDERYFLIFYLWLACNGHAQAECDLLIDTGRTGAAYQRRVTERIEAATGVRIDLSTMHAAPPRVTFPAVQRARIEASAMAIFPWSALPVTRARCRPTPTRRCAISPQAFSGRRAWRGLCLKTD